MQSCQQERKIRGFLHSALRAPVEMTQFGWGRKVLGPSRSAWLCKTGLPGMQSCQHERKIRGFLHSALRAPVEMTQLGWGREVLGRSRSAWLCKNGLPGMQSCQHERKIRGFLRYALRAPVEMTQLGWGRKVLCEMTQFGMGSGEGSCATPQRLEQKVVWLGCSLASTSEANGQLVATGYVAANLANRTKARAAAPGSCG